MGQNLVNRNCQTWTDTNSQLNWRYFFISVDSEPRKQPVKRAKATKKQITYLFSLLALL